MVYPVVVLVIAGLILSFLLVFIVPKFQQIFKDALGPDHPLPGITLFVIACSDFMVERWYLIIGGIVALVATYKAFAATPAGVIGQFTALWRSVLTGSELEAGCAVAAVAVDAGPEQEQLVELAGSVFAEWRDALARRLERVGMSQERSRDLALLSLAAMEGALVVCRAQRSIEDFDRVAAMLVSLGGSGGGGGAAADAHG